MSNIFLCTTAIDMFDEKESDTGEAKTPCWGLASYLVLAAYHLCAEKIMRAPCFPSLFLPRFLLAVSELHPPK